MDEQGRMPSPGGVESTRAAAPLPSASPASTPTYGSLIAQAKGAQDTLGAVETQLNTPNLKLKRSQNHLLRNKLQDATEYTRAAAGKLGIDSPAFKIPPGTGPIDRFLAYVNDGQEQMSLVSQKLQELASSNTQISPADMLLVQVKLNQAQQEIEYSSTLLGKVIDSLKTVLNTQL
jgi:hypothetical protein